MQRIIHGAVVCSILAASVVPAIGAVAPATLHAPSPAALAGLYKTLRKFKSAGPVARKVAPGAGGNVVVGTFSVQQCTKVSDPATEAWTCSAQIVSRFRTKAVAPRGHEATQITAKDTVAIEWNPTSQVLSATVTPVSSPPEDPLVFLEAGDPVLGEVLRVLIRREVDCSGGDLTDHCRQAVAPNLLVVSIPGTDRCGAYYQMAATSDVSPDRVIDATTALARKSRFTCP